MRFLGIGQSCDLGALYLRLIEEGHEVRVHIGDPLCRGTLAGLVPQTADWQQDLGWIREAGADGILLFESVTGGAEQDALRRDGYRVVGGSAFGDRLENDRSYGQALLAKHGLRVAATWPFATADAALAFIEDMPARYVLKFDRGAFGSSANYVGQREDGRDLRALLLARRDEIAAVGATFVLTQHIQGIEMGTGAYFDGKQFLEPACLDWEHKRFFPGDLGELTGEMGTIVTYERGRSFFQRTLKKLEPAFRAHGHCGYVNLNTIVNAEGIWPLEFTCRFGYPGFAILQPLQEAGWAELFRAMTGGGGAFRTRPGFAAGLVLTTPPFPYTRKQVAAPIGLPVLIAGERGDHFHLGEVGLMGDELVTSGIYGWTMVVTGTDATIDGARRAACARAARVTACNLRYRRDIGERLEGGEFAQLEEWGYLDR